MLFDYNTRLASPTYLGNLKELLGDLDDLAQRLDVVNSLIHGLGVVGTSSIQDVLLLLDLSISPGVVERAEVFEGAVEDAEKTECGNGLLVHDVELVTDSGDGDTGSSGEDRGLGNDRVSRKGINNGLSLGLGVLGWDIGVEPSRCEGRECGSVAGNKDGPGTSGAWGQWGSIDELSRER